MNCEYVQVTDSVVQCVKCGRTFKTHFSPAQVHTICTVPGPDVKETAVSKLKSLGKRCTTCKDGIMSDQLLQAVLEGTGPGSQLWHIFGRLGIEHRPDCSCLLLADIMNDLGPQGCRERRDDLLRLMRKNQKKYGWHTFLKAGVKALTTGMVFKVNPTDPLPGLLDLAIRKAEESPGEVD